MSFELRRAEVHVWLTPVQLSAALERRSGQEQRQLFFRFWTGKEAWIKAVGGGLSIPLRRWRPESTGMSTV